MNSPFTALISVNSPHGAQWEFLVVFAVVLLGPVLIERARVPGIVGLIIGGYLIGPHGFGFITAGNQTIPELGKLGLLYLMFVAGVELDLRLLRANRNTVVSFGILTFMFPMLFGVAVGFGIGWSVAAALLLGSMLASHTLLVYPVVRAAKLAGDESVATAVGATVLTDTISLVILAAVAGAEQGTGGPAELAFQIAFGLFILGTFSFVVLPWLADLAFRLLGHDPKVRYIVAIAAFLSAATVAELFGIEGIVGAFAAGLALNRLVPNEGTLMERVDFFGGAVFVPVFLVSVGLILDPTVMVEPTTMGLAGLLIVACLGGKFVAAELTRKLYGYSSARAKLIYALTSPQAAATLATVVVGFNIGLFDTSVVNATLVLILVSVIVASLVGDRATKKIPVLGGLSAPLGARVLVATADAGSAGPALHIASLLARPDGGVVRTIAVSGDDRDAPAFDDVREELADLSHRAGVDGSVDAVVDNTLASGALHDAVASRATLVLLVDDEGGVNRLDRSIGVPVVTVRGGDGESVDVRADPATAGTDVIQALKERISRQSDGAGAVVTLIDAGAPVAGRASPQ